MYIRYEKDFWVNVFFKYHKIRDPATRRLLTSLPGGDSTVVEPVHVLKKEKKRPGKTEELRT